VVELVSAGDRNLTAGLYGNPALEPANVANLNMDGICLDRCVTINNNVGNGAASGTLTSACNTCGMVYC
jgi:hypothetical protein